MRRSFACASLVRRRCRQSSIWLTCRFRSRSSISLVTILSCRSCRFWYVIGSCVSMIPRVFMLSFTSIVLLVCWCAFI